MGFTALDGLPMGTRPGQIDPGVVLYLISEKGMSASNVQDFLYRDCGLKGLSGISNDMRELEASEDPKAKLAIEYFVYRSASTPACSRPRCRGSTRLFSPPDRRKLGADPFAGRRTAALARRHARSRPRIPATRG